MTEKIAGLIYEYDFQLCHLSLILSVGQPINDLLIVSAMINPLNTGDSYQMPRWLEVRSKTGGFVIHQCKPTKLITEP